MLILCVYLLIQRGSSLSSIKLHLIIERGRVRGKGGEILVFSSSISFQGIFQNCFAFINLEFMEWWAWATWGQNPVLCCSSPLCLSDSCCRSQDILGRVLLPGHSYKLFLKIPNWLDWDVTDSGGYGADWGDKETLLISVKKLVTSPDFTAWTHKFLVYCPEDTRDSHGGQEVITFHLSTLGFLLSWATGFAPPPWW